MSNYNSPNKSFALQPKPKVKMKGKIKQPKNWDAYRKENRKKGVYDT